MIGRIYKKILDFLRSIDLITQIIWKIKIYKKLLPITYDLTTLVIKKSLNNYVGVKRRFSFLGKKNKAIIYDDYAHHPTEIKATLLAAKNIDTNIVIVFQPHRFSRTKYLMDEFIQVLSSIKKLYLLKTYKAGERTIRGATSKDIFKKLSSINQNSIYIENEINLNKELLKETIKKNLIIFMGAGSITKIAKDFVQN